MDISSPHPTAPARAISFGGKYSYWVKTFWRAACSVLTLAETSQRLPAAAAVSPQRLWAFPASSRRTHRLLRRTAVLPPLGTSKSAPTPEPGNARAHQRLIGWPDAKQLNVLECGTSPVAASNHFFIVVA
jgi:hypothetical protein